MRCATRGWLIGLGLWVWFCPTVRGQEAEWRLFANRLEWWATQRVLAEGDAEIQLGKRRLLAQRIEVDLQSGWALAEGDVRLLDEMGFLEAQRARVNLRTRQGEMYGIRGEAQGVLFVARTLQLQGSLLDMQGVELTTCRRRPSEWRIVAERVRLNAALRMEANRVSLFIRNTRVVTLPRLSRLLSGGSEPFAPRFSYSNRHGIRLIYDDLLSLGEVRLRYETAASLRKPLQVRADLWRRFDYSEDDEPLTPLANEETYPTTFLETWELPTWQREGESATRRAARISLRANSSFENLQSTDLLVTGAEAVYQLLQPKGGGTWQLESRIGYWHEKPTRQTAWRATLHARWQSPLIAWHPLYSDIVVDGRLGAYSRGQHYSWGRLLWEVYWRQSEGFQVGLGFGEAQLFGQSPFLFDRLETQREVRLRLSVHYNWHVDLLARWDVEQRRWYEWQIALSPPSHCVQPLLGWSSRQRQLKLQVRLVR